MKEEKRKHPRFHLDQLIQVGPFRETYVHARGINISENGMLYSTYEPCELYQQVFAMISFDYGDKKETIKCDGAVIRMEEHDGKYKVAVNFESMDDDNRAALKRYLKKSK